MTSAPARGDEESDSGSSPFPLSVLFTVAFVTGLIALTLQTVLVRILSLSLGSSEYTYCMVVAAYIALIALGSWFIVGRRKPLISLWANLLLVLLSLTGLFVLIPYAPYGFHILRSLFNNGAVSFYLFHASAFLVIMTFLALPVACLGSALPLLFVHTPGKQNCSGKVVGSLYALNALGCLLGAVIGGHLLFHFFNMNLVLLGVLGLLGACVLSVYPWHDAPSPSRLRLAVVLLACISTAFWTPWNEARLGIGLFHEREALPLSYQGPSALYTDLFQGMTLLERRDGPNMSVAVAEFRHDDGSSADKFSRTIYVNGKADGNTSGDRVPMKTLGHLAGLLSPGKTGRGAVVGFGTGMTLGALSLYPEFKSIDSVDISPLVHEYAKHFDFANHQVLSKDTINWITSDAFLFLRQGKTLYDSIVSQPSNPWLSGIDRLYTEEFYTSVRKRLHEEGVFVQWLSLWGSSRESTEIVLNTFERAFPHGRFFKFRDSLFFLGFMSEPTVNTVSTLQKRFRNPEIAKELAQLGYTSPEVLLSLELWYPEKVFAGDKHNSVFWPSLGFQAGRDFFADAHVELESLMDTPEKWRGALLRAENTLLAHYLSSSPQLDLARISEASCGGTQVELMEPQWRYSRTTCRDSVIARMVSGESAVPERLSPEIRWVRTYLRDPYSLRKPRNGVEAKAEIVMFTQFYSLFLPLSVDALIDRTNVCRESLLAEDVQCRAQLAMTLAYIGKLDQAKAEMNALRLALGSSKHIAFAQNWVQELLQTGQG